MSSFYAVAKVIWSSGEEGWPQNEVVDAGGFVIKLNSHVRSCRGAPALPVLFLFLPGLKDVLLVACYDAANAIVMTLLTMIGVGDAEEIPR